MRKVMSLLMILPILIFGGYRFLAMFEFDRFCSSYLRRAVQASTIELATKDLEITIRNLEFRGMTEGYTSILYKTPNEDVEFMYLNLKATLRDLENVPQTLTALEKDTILFNFREKIQAMKYPEGISIFPNNTLWFWFLMMSLLGAIIGYAIFPKGLFL